MGGPGAGKYAGCPCECTVWHPLSARAVERFQHRPLQGGPDPTIAGPVMRPWAGPRSRY